MGLSPEAPAATAPPLHTAMNRACAIATPLASSCTKDPTDHETYIPRGNFPIHGLVHGVGEVGGVPCGMLAVPPWSAVMMVVNSSRRDVSRTTHRCAAFNKEPRRCAHSRVGERDCEYTYGRCHLGRPGSASEPDRSDPCSACDAPCAMCDRVAREVARLSAYLQEKYSTTLYRRPGAVAADSLSVLWLRLFPAAALRAIALVGVCKVNSAPPSRPYYWGHGIGFGTPLDTIFVHRSRLPQPLPNHSWAEVLHCRLRHIRNSTFSRGHEYPFWAYVAPGSGVSVNIGRTLVVRGYGEALALMKAIYGAPNPADPDPDFSKELSTHILTHFDSVQLVNHREYHSEEPRHELVLLHHHETDSLRDLQASVALRCGRHPDLYECSPDDFTRFETCNQHLSSRMAAAVGATGRCTVGNGSRIQRFDEAFASDRCFNDCHYRRASDVVQRMVDAGLPWRDEWRPSEYSVKG